MQSFLWSLEIWEAFGEKTKKLDLHETLTFSLFKPFPVLLVYWPLQLDKKCFLKIDLYRLNLVSSGTRLIDINYLKLYVKIFLLVCSVFTIQWVYHVINKFVWLGYVSRVTSSIIEPDNTLKLCNTLLQICYIRCYTQFVVLYEIPMSISYSLL